MTKHMAAALIAFVSVALLLSLTSCAAKKSGNDTTAAQSEPTESATTTTETTTAQTVKTPSGLGAQSVYTLTKLPIARAVQQFALVRVGGVLNIFAVQRNETSIYLSRCVLSDDGRTAPVADYAILTGYGHGESFDVSERDDGTVYIYIGSGANKITDSAWATTVTRLKYDSGTISDEKTITGMQYATETGAILYSGATPYRVNFALCEESDLIVFYIRTDNGNTGKNVVHYLMAYKFSDIDKMLDSCAGSISLADCGKSLLNSSGKKTAGDICFNGSFQGMELDADGKMYITGGGSAIRPQLSEFDANSDGIPRKDITNINWVESQTLGSLDFGKIMEYSEIESVKYFEGGLYCSFNPTSKYIQNGTEIFVFQKK